MRLIRSSTERPDSGNTLISVLIAAGVGAVVMLGMLRTQEIGIKSQKGLEHMAQAQEFSNLLRMLMSQPSVTKNALVKTPPLSFNYTNTSSLQLQDQITISYPTPAGTPGPDFAKKDVSFKDWKITKTGLKVVSSWYASGTPPASPPPYPDRHLVKLVYEMEKTASSFGGAAKTVEESMVLVATSGSSSTVSITGAHAGPTADDERVCKESLGGTYDSTKTPPCDVRGCEDIPSPAKVINGTSYPLQGAVNAGYDTHAIQYCKELGKTGQTTMLEFVSGNCPTVANFNGTSWSALGGTWGCVQKLRCCRM